MACDLETPEPTPRQPPQLIGAWVTTGYDEQGAPLRSALAEEGLLQGVRRSSTIALEFDRFLHPASVLRQAICVRPSTDPVEQLEDCGRPPQPFLEPFYSPARRQVVFYLAAGELLAADTLYRLTLFPPSEASDFGFRAFDSAALDRHYRFDFTTSSDQEAVGYEPAPSSTRYCRAQQCVRTCRDDPALRDDPEAQQACIADRCDCLDGACTSDGDLTDPDTGIFAASCARASCHSGGDPAAGIPWGLGNAAMGLDLSSPEAIEQTAIGRAAHQTQAGDQGAIAAINAEPFGRAMPIIAPANPGNSYLLYKLIAQTLNHPRPEGTVDAELASAVDRLRSSVVVGQPMPPDDGLLGSAGDVDGSRAFQRLLLFERWVAHGAVTVCP